MNTKLPILSLLLVGALFFSCAEQGNKQIQTDSAESKDSLLITTEDTEPETIIDIPDDRPLNDIRFGNWTEKDWYDNGYFRFLRKCMDDCLKGVDNEDTQQLQDHKSAIKDKFFIYDAEPFIGGGLLITLGFLNNPQVLYQTVVYSNVDEETEAVVGYSLLNVKKLEETIYITKEDIQQAMKELPELKLW